MIPHKNKPVLILGLTIIITILVQNYFVQKDRAVVVIDGQLYIGQSRDDFQTALSSLGYKKVSSSLEMDPDETRYKISQGDAFIRVSYFRDGSVSKLSGCPQNLSFEGHPLLIGVTDLSTIKSVLGEPSWEKYVGGAIGVCYKNHDLYLVIVEGRLAGFSLGEVPDKP